ncbi:hypothetical protein TNCV_2515401 [Trichonephila clavipes]|nr:hypothetical protein TNCV_2515401 [Trichonephila clavipes]
MIDGATLWLPQTLTAKLYVSMSADMLLRPAIYDTIGRHLQHHMQTALTIPVLTQVQQVPTRFLYEPEFDLHNRREQSPDCRRNKGMIGIQLQSVLVPLHNNASSLTSPVPLGSFCSVAENPFSELAETPRVSQ